MADNFIYNDPKKGGSKKGITRETQEEKNTRMLVCVLRCRARESLKKCEDPGAKNSERVFVKGDQVDVICTSRKDFEEGKDVKVWLIATKRRNGKSNPESKEWLRPLERIRGILDVVEEKRISVAVVEHGRVRGKRTISDSIKCSSVVLWGFTFWIEDGTFPTTNPEDPCHGLTWNETIGKWEYENGVPVPYVDPPFCSLSPSQLPPQEEKEKEKEEDGMDGYNMFDKRGFYDEDDDDDFH